MSSWPQHAIKICGLRTAEHALTAAQAGATHLGMILAPSRRQIEPTLARSIVNTVRQQAAHVQCVGVFVNASAEQMNQLADFIGLDVLQLSGDEPTAVVHQLQRPVLKALRAPAAPEAQAWLALSIERQATLRILLDAHVAGSYGGAGVLGDWHQAAQLARQQPLLLAGGLDPDNVTAAVQAVQPWGVDVSSGIETAGIKDHSKIVAFVAAARHALAQPSRSKEVI